MSPYSEGERKKKYEGIIRALEDEWLDSAKDRDGEMCYVIVRLLQPYWILTKWAHKMDAIKILEGAKLEIYRRALVPHEEKAKERNGDVF